MSAISSTQASGVWDVSPGALRSVLQEIEPLNQRTVTQCILSYTHTFLDWTKRPNALKGAIDKAFAKLKNNDTSSWGLYNGSSEYRIMVDEYELAKSIIRQAPPSQKEFYFLDVGAGNFQWLSGMAEALQDDFQIPAGITIHLIGIRGERNLANDRREKGPFRFYKFGAFKVEEMEKEFQTQKLDLTGKIDLAVSHWSLRHLADPVGTFVQVYNLLRPITGHFCFDGFFFLSPNERRGRQKDPNLAMAALLLETEAPFLWKSYEVTRSLDHFLLRRPDSMPCQLSMSYCQDIERIRCGQIGSYVKTKFHKPDQDQRLSKGVNNKKDDNCIYGDKALFDELRSKGLLQDTKWTKHICRPIQESKNDESGS